MRIKVLICMVLCTTLLCTTINAESYWNLALEDNSHSTDDQKQSKQSSQTYKEYHDDLLKGYLMAIFPGFIIHGLGNMSAGNGRFGGALLAVEISSLIGFFLFALSGIDGSSSEDIGVLSSVLFFGSWLLDIFTVGRAVKAKYKKRKVEISILQPMPGKSMYKDCIGLVSLSINF